MDVLNVNPSFPSPLEVPRKQCVIESLEVLQAVVKRKPTTGSLRVHFPLKNLATLSLQPKMKEETFYEVLYDTNQFRLLPKRWLWKRSGVWILKVDDDSEPGTSVFFSKTGNDATDDLRQHLGESWETLVEPIVTLKTTRVYVTDHHWIDFTSWSRWRIGYYAVQTIAIACEDIDELEPLSTTDDFFPVPSKGVACLRHILPQKFEAIFRGRTCNDAAFLFFSLLAIPFVRTDKPLYGPEIDDYDSEGDSDNSSDESIEE